MRAALMMIPWMMAGTAHAAPNLSVTGTCPGPMTVTISGLTPGGSYYLARAQNAGVATIPGGPCGGTEIRLNPASPGWSVSTLSSPPSGTATFSITAPASMCNRRFEVVDVGSCQVSNVWDFNYPQCNPAQTYLATAADHASLAACQTLNDVYVTQPGFVGPSSVTSINLPNLVHLGSMLSVVPGPLTAVSLPALRRVGSTVSFVESTSLASFTAPLWGGSADVLQFSTTTALPSLSLPALKSLGALEVTVNGPISAPALNNLDTAFLSGAYTSLDFGALEAVNYLLVESPALTSLDLGELLYIGDAVSPHTEYVYVSNNPLLTYVDVHSLDEVDSFYLFNNSSLCPATTTALYPDWAAITVRGQLAVGANQPGCFEIFR